MLFSRGSGSTPISSHSVSSSTIPSISAIDHSPERALDRQEGSSSDTEGCQLLSESITVGAVKAAVDISQQLVQCIVQFDLIFRRLRVDQVVLVGFETRFACQNETEHRTHHSPMVRRWTKEQQVEKSHHQTRKQVGLSRQMLSDSEKHEIELVKPLKIEYRKTDKN